MGREFLNAHRFPPTMHAMNLLRRAASRAWMLCLALALIPAALGQAPGVLENTVFTLGTTTRDATLRDWAYVVVQPTEAALLANRKLAVYIKAGDAAAANAYQRRSILALQTDPAAIQVLLQRGASIGDNLAELEGRVNALFAAIMPAGNLSLPDKLSSVIRGSLAKPQYFETLAQLARLHPSVNLCLGFAHAELIGTGKFTFEIRDFDPVTSTDRGVLGRVTVEAGNPLVLPAPGRPFEVVDPSAKGHLNVKLRWSTPDDFRRISLLSYGYHLYRVPKSVADAKPALFLAMNPARDAFLDQAKTNPAVVKVKSLPILARQLYDESAAPNPTSVYTTTNHVGYVADDGGLAAGVYHFHDGDAFYYYVTGRDLLGRDGFVSGPTLVTLCDRMPPDAPRMPVVENYYAFVGGASEQRLKVSWKPVQAGADDTGIAGYYVYRWSAPAEIAKFENSPPLRRISALIPHVPGQSLYQFVDSGAGAPSTPSDLGKTYWYTVRAIDLSSCGGNFSPNSAPAFGVLRDREGPAGPQGGGPGIVCCTPLVAPTKPFDQRTEENLDPSSVYFDLVCKRVDEGIAWADFWFGTSRVSSNYLGRIHFPNNQTDVVRRLPIPQNRLGGNAIQYAYCRVGAPDGKMSGIAAMVAEGYPRTPAVRRFEFAARTECRPTRSAATTGQSPCNSHSPRPPHVIGDTNYTTGTGVVVAFPLTPTAREFRLYRRVDYGALTLIKQGVTKYDAVTNLVVEIPDNDMPANSGVICYYGQLLDEHGNPSPTAQLGDCIGIDLPTATPLLAPVEPLGSDANPRMVVRWFCAPAGIERFQVTLGILGEPAPATMGAVLSANQEAGSNFESINPASPPPQWKFVDFGSYLTPQVGPNFGDGAAFSVTLPVALGKKYYVKIRTVAKGGSQSRVSNLEPFLWQAPPSAVGPKVPWPQRPLVSPTQFDPRVQAARLVYPDFNGIGVRIGEFGRSDGREIKGETNTVVMLSAGLNPEQFLYTNTLGETILPAALYRYQLPSTAYVDTSGDVVQVSPLLEKIAVVTTAVPNLGTFVQIVDPFVRATPLDLQSQDIPSRGLYLLDTTPVVVNARYGYLLVRFGDTGEVRSVHPTDPVDVTP